MPTDNSPAAAPTREQIATWRHMVQSEALLDGTDAELNPNSAQTYIDRASHWRALDALLERLADRAARLGMTETTDTERLDKLLRFAGNALTEVRVREIGDWDGGDMQDVLADCGLIEEVLRIVPCGEGCRCSEFYAEGETAICYPLTELGHEAVRAFRAWQDRETEAASQPAAPTRSAP